MLILLFSHALAKPSAPPAPATPTTFGFDGTGNPLVTYEDLESACDTIQNCATPPAAGSAGERVEAYCGWTSGNLPPIPTPADLEQSACQGAGAPGTPGRTLGVAAAPAMSSQAAIISGLSDFMVERGEEELTAWLLSKLEDRICEASATKPALLPETCDLLDGNSLLISTTGIALLQRTVREDLLGLPRRLVEFQYAQAADSATRSPLLIAGVLARTSELLLSSVKPVDAVSAWGRSRAWTAYASDVTGSDAAIPLSVYTASVVAGSLPTGIVENPAQTIDELYLAKTALINLKASGALPALTSLAPTLQEERLAAALVQAGEGATTSLRQANQALAKIGAFTSSTTDEERLATAASVASATLAGISSTMHAVAGLLASPPASLTRAQDLLEDAGVIAASLSALDYAGACVAALRFIEDTGVVKDGKPKKAMEAATRTVVFGAAVASSRSPQDAESAVRSFVAPPGGYARKRSEDDGRGYVTLNGYVGVGGALSTALASTADGIEPASSLFPTVTLGPEFGFTPAGKFSVGIYGSVVDLGQVAAVRFDSGDSQASPTEVTFRQVFSPGGWLVVGLPDAPFTIGGGAAISPGSIENTSGEPLDTLRLGAFLAIDLALLP